MSADRRPFKLWFDADLVRATARSFSAVEPRFDARGFVRRVTRGLDGMEMLARVGCIADALHSALPRPTAAALGALVATLPAPLGETGGVTEAGYRFWPYGEYIARHARDDFEAAFAAMLELTQRFSAEFAVRPYLAERPDETLDRLAVLVDHPSPHVRRWISEGTRSRLPWGKRVPELEARAPRRLELLSQLRHDPARYVRLSVANHLQDLLKDDRALAFPTLAAWAREDAEHSEWIARHAARGLLKQGDPETLALFGNDPAGVEIVAFTITPRRLPIGGTVELSATVRNLRRRSLKVRLDYALTSPGKASRPTRKVFRLADLTLAAGEEGRCHARHAFLHRTIRTIRPGEHLFTLLANGRPSEPIAVRVREP